ncbi:MAG: hypothetical protein ACI8ZN_000987 [Bacteroidia bacterium]
MQNLKTIWRLIGILFLMGGTQLCGSTLPSNPWKNLQSDQLNFYYHEQSEEKIIFLLPESIKMLHALEDKIGYRLSGKLDIYVYNSVAHLNESRVKEKPKPLNIQGGTTEIQSNSIELYFSESGDDLFNQLSVAIADNLLVEMLYGGSVQDRIRYATLLSLPLWFKDGLTQYLALGWDAKADDELRDAFNHKRISSYNRLSDDLKILAGRNMWDYVVDTKGEQAIQRILYLVRLTRKVETGLYYILNQNSKELYASWFKASEIAYAAEVVRRVPANTEQVSYKGGSDVLHSLSISPDENMLATAYTSDGRFIIELYNRNLGTRTRLCSKFVHFEGRIVHQEYAHLAWKNNAELICIENKAQPTIQIWNQNGTLISANTLPFHQINHMDFHAPEQNLVLSATNNGSTNLILYSVKYQSITYLSQGYIFDDVQPSFDQFGNIYFSRFSKNEESPGPNYTLSNNQTYNSDVYYLIRNKTQVLNLTNITNTPLYNEFYPIALNTAYVSFLSDRNGIINAYAYNHENEIFALSDYQCNIRFQTKNNKNGLISEVVLTNGLINISIYQPDSASNFGAISHPNQTKVLKNRLAQKSSRNKSTSTNNIDTSLIQDYDKVYFQSSFGIPINIDSLEKIENTVTNHLSYKFNVSTEKYNGLRPSLLSTQLNNGHAITEEFATFLPDNQLIVNNMGIILGLRLEDQSLKNIFNTRIKIFFNLNRIEYDFSYINNGSKSSNVLQISGFERTFTIDEIYYDYVFNNLSFNKKYKLSTTLNNTIGIAGRRDYVNQLSVTETSLRLPPRKQLMAEIENVLTKSTRIEADVFRSNGFEARLTTKLRYLSNSKAIGISNSLRLDYGRKLVRDLSIDGHFEAVISHGGAKNIFYLGGTRNQFYPNYNHQSEISSDHSPFYQPVYGIRNAQLNSRNGNNYAFFNLDFNIAVNHWLSKYPLRKSFYKNLNIILFSDLGSAWYGRSPYDTQNPSNVTSFQNGVLDITVYNTKNPMVFSNGIGLNTIIWGYQIRYSVAWVADNNVWQRGAQSFALGKAF